MNRAIDRFDAGARPVPYTRGDEPANAITGIIASEPFPTCVGMNRKKLIAVSLFSPVPYMRGDEPVLLFNAVSGVARSLHAWG